MLRGGGHIRKCGLFQRIISPENLFVAWREFRRGKRAKKDIQEFEFALEDNIFQLHEVLAGGMWRHDVYVPFHITDPKSRQIHKATVRDRLLHHAVFRVLYPLFDPGFIYDSYSCRVDKGTHRAVHRLEMFAGKMSANNRRNFWVLKCDIRRFFDSIDHEILLMLIRRRVDDEEVFRLIRHILSSFSKVPGVGLPLGNVTSQLFANIYLNELDRFVKHRMRVKFYLRYCDDFLILGDDPHDLLAGKNEIQDFLSHNLHLALHPNKVSIRKYSQGIDFLGYVVRPHHTVIRTKTKRRMVDRVETRNAPSYFGMLRHCDGYGLRKCLKTKLSTGL